MPYLRLDLAKTYPSRTKRELAARLCHLYAGVMQTQFWRPNVGSRSLPRIRQRHHRTFGRRLPRRRDGPAGANARAAHTDYFDCGSGQQRRLSL